jgi:hypothetical protein
MIYIKKKNCSPLRRAIFNSFGHKTQIKEETALNITNAFSKIFLEFFSCSKTV